jgi:hypothetical protein
LNRDNGNKNIMKIHELKNIYFFFLLLLEVYKYGLVGGLDMNRINEVVCVCVCAAVGGELHMIP